MLEKIKELLERFTSVCDNYEKYHMPIRADVYQCLTDIQAFIEQLLVTFNDAEMQKDVMEILEDMLIGLQQEDEVLLYDAVKYGLMEYIKAFVEVSEGR